MTSSLTTYLAVLIGTAKLKPCAIAIISVLMPITRARLSTSGPPELPGLSGTSVCNKLSPNRKHSENKRDVQCR